jgi:DNA polymerase-3 subunit epsilon
VTRLFFDTETTGTVDFRSPPDAPHQPRLVQLAALLVSDDGREISALKVIVRPQGFEIPDSASAVHGITTKAAAQTGVPLLHAVAVFCALARVADQYVCHNLDFDLSVMQGESLRIITEFPIRSYFCTMKAMTDVCQLPGGPRGFKWPKLIEAYRHAFGKDFDGARDAMADVRACRDVFFWMQQRKAQS